MAPIIAGVFPVLIFVACRKRSVGAKSRKIGILSARFLLVLILAGSTSVSVFQTNSDVCSTCYRCLSAGLCLSLFWLLVGLYRNGACRSGGVVLIAKVIDGWNPSTWRVFEGDPDAPDRNLL